MKSFFILFLFILSPFVTFAKAKVVFLLGKVEVSIAGKTDNVKVGMIIEDNAVVKTHTDSRVVLLDFNTRTSFLLKSNSTFKIKDYTESKGQALLRSLIAKRRNNITPEVVAAVRGPGYWGLFNKKSKISRKLQWDLYKSGHFADVISKTKGVSDAEGLYLNTMSRYHSSKDGNPAIIKDLKKVLKTSFVPGLRLEAKRDLVYIHFENGSFSEALKVLKNMERTLSWQDWDDRSFYILIMTYYYVGQQKKATTYKDIMQKYFPSSPLLKYLPI